jgi:hypothetical protein
MADKLYNLANMRALLLNGFDDRELRRLCQDVPDFRPVYNELARNTGKGEIVDELLAYAEKQLLMDTLLALAKDQNPSRYDHHGPYYHDDPTPALQKQISDLAKRLAAITSPTSLTSEQQYQIAFHWEDLGGKDSLRGFILKGTNLAGAILNGADLRGADLAQANLCGTLLRRANLTGADLEDAKLRGADLTRTNLRGANLYKANLNGAYLCKANLHGANLYKANLRGASLYEADLCEAQVTQEQLDRARSLEGATLPDGAKHTGQAEPDTPPEATS